MSIVRKIERALGLTNEHHRRSKKRSKKKAKRKKNGQFAKRG